MDRAVRMKRVIDAARGLIPPDLILKGGKVVNIFTHEVVETDVAILDGTIVGLGEYDGPKIIQTKGDFICPGFIDGHFHIESTMLSPLELSRAVIPMGTTAIVADPHELSNVLGKDGIRYMLEMSKDLPVDIYIMLPSCVPSTDMETSGATITATDLVEFRDEPRVLGLGEMMNYPGVLSGVPPVLEKLTAFNNKIKDGHAPLLSGKDLNAYIAAGIRSDHECTNLDEAREKLSLGMYIMIREGTQAKNLKDLIPLVSSDTLPRCMLVTDDCHPDDLMEKGHMNYIVNLAISEGVDPVQAIQMASYNVAQYLGLKYLGAIAPGYQADLLVLSSLNPVEVRIVLKRGEKVYEDGCFYCSFPERMAERSLGSMNIRPFSPEDFVIHAEGALARVIGLRHDQISTSSRILPIKTEKGVVVSDQDRDIVKIAVLERHKATGNIGLGLVQGFGLREGALASSVAHDSHNIMVVGCTDEDMFLAAKTVEEMNGGLAVVKNRDVLEKLALPIGGLMSERPLEEIAILWKSLTKAAKTLGCAPDQPFMALSFLALPVIPELRITDKGLIDVKLFRIVPLFL